MLNRCVLVVALAAATVCGMSNMTFTPDTINFGDSVTVTGDYAKLGDTCQSTIYFDRNGNGRVDATDVVLWDTHGSGSFMVDTGASTHFVTRFQANGGPLEVVGTLIWISKDSGPADTASLVMRAWGTSGPYVSGTVTGPSGPLADIIIVLKPSGCDSGTCFENVARTDSAGHYRIYIPSALTGAGLELTARDDIGTQPGLVAPASRLITIADSLPATNFVFQAPGAFVKGTLVDDIGSPVSDFELQVSCDSPNISMMRRTDSAGVFIAGVSPGQWRVRSDNRPSMTGYLCSDTTVGVAAGSDTVKFQMRAYRVDDSIGGRVIDSVGINLPNSVEVYAQPIKTGALVQGGAMVAADGRFTIPVAKRFALYSVGLWYNDLPFGTAVRCVHADSVAPGSDSVLVYILPPHQFVRGLVVDQTGTPVGNLPMTITADWSPSYSVRTDATGRFVAPITAGAWDLNVDTLAYLGSVVMFSVSPTDDTVSVVDTVLKADTTISGTIGGSFASVKQPFEVIASVHDTVSGHDFSQTVQPDTGGRFTFRVSRHFTTYNVFVNQGSLPSGFVAAIPPGKPYTYDRVPIGTTDVYFVIMTTSGAIRGREIGIPMDSINGHMSVTITDSVLGIMVGQQLAADSTYFLAVPNGTYKVAFDYCYPHSCPHKELAGVVVSNDTVIVNLTTGGVGLGARRVVAPRVASLQILAGRMPTAALYLPSLSSVTVALYDIAGRCVTTAYRGAVQAGTLRVALTNAHGSLPAGTYVVRVTIRAEQTVVLQRKVVQTR